MMDRNSYVLIGTSTEKSDLFDGDIRRSVTPRDLYLISHPDTDDLGASHG